LPLPRKALPLPRKAVLLAALALLPGCTTPGLFKVSAPPDGVTVKDITADLAYGGDEAAGQSAGQPVGPVGPAARALTTVFPMTPPEEEVPVVPRRRPIPPGPAAGPCPTAGGDSFPEKVAGKVIEGAPAPGLYRWKQSGTVAFNGGPPVPIESFTTRAVRVVSATPALIVYEEEATMPGGTQTRTIEVRTEGLPTDGVYLTRLKSDGMAAFDFHPPATVALKLMSLPVVTERVNSAAVDPVAGIAITISGDVDASGRARLDACGETVDAWSFKGTRTIQSTTNPNSAMQAATYHTFFAPQLGGLFVGERMVLNSTFGALPYSVDVAANIGALKPKAAS
jgi:hypothetical protein